MSEAIHALLIVLVCAGVTLALRAAPFTFFGGKDGVPPIIERLGRMLPPAIMAALVVYCLKTVPFGSFADGAKQLLRGVDGNKDQSYFLYMLGQKALDKAMFPVEGLTKAQVREIAKEAGLVN